MSACSRDRWLAAAELGLAAWFFGNLYETTVNLPDVLADRGETRLIDAGSPVRYYSPAVPPTFAATAVTLRGLWRDGASRPLVATAAAETVP